MDFATHLQKAQALQNHNSWCASFSVSSIRESTYSSSVKQSLTWSEMASMCHTGRNCLLLPVLEYHLKEKFFYYFKQKTRREKFFFTGSHGLSSNVRLHLRLRSDASFFASLFIVLACTPVFFSQYPVSSNQEWDAFELGFDSARRIIP